MEKPRLQALADDAAHIMRLPHSSHGGGKALVTVPVGDLRDMAVLALEALEWRENVEAMLSDGDKDVIRCHEGGGPESLVGSLGLTMIRTRWARDREHARTRSGRKKIKRATS